MDYNFKVDLQGIIDLLSNHLYSGPEVYLRELLQNAVDALRARQQLNQTTGARYGSKCRGSGARGRRCWRWSTTESG